MRWPWSPKTTEPSAVLSISDPLVARLFSPGIDSDLGVEVSEQTVMGLSAFYRAVSLISGQLASLPLNTYTGTEGKRVSSIFDNPHPEGQTPFEWKETLFSNMIMHGAAGALKVRNAVGSLVALPLVHPGHFSVQLPTLEEAAEGKRPLGGLWFDVTLDTGEQKRYDANDFWYVPGHSLDGKTGVSLLHAARLSLSTSIVADRAAGKMFSSGALIAGMVTPDDDGPSIEDDVPQIRREINNQVLGFENAGNIPVLNRRLKFQPFSMSAADAQFLQSRQFQIEEISRLTGVPPHLLMQTEKQTSWGTGVEMQDRALGRTVLGVWAGRFEERASRLIANPRYVEFDFIRLERPSPDREIELDLQQVKAGVMTIDEYRMKRGWKPMSAQADSAPAPSGEPAPDPTTATAKAGSHA